MLAVGLLVVIAGLMGWFEAAERLEVSAAEVWRWIEPGDIVFAR